MIQRWWPWLAWWLLAFGSVLASAAEHPAALAYLQELQARSGAPGISAAVAVGGRILFSAGLGLSDLESGLPQNGRSVHNIGSISKTQAVVAVLQLVQRGKVELDEEIQTYVPWFPRKAKPVTVRQILTHTSGIRHYKDGEFGPDDVLAFRHYEVFEESTRFWRDDALLFEPGTHYLYSTFATTLMQAIVEHASGRPFETYLQEHVWGPAGMLDTRFDVSWRIVARRGRGYVRRETGELAKAQDEDVSYKYAGGGMLSTDEDLCRFGHALNAGILLERPMLAEMYRLQLPADIPYTAAEIAAFKAQGSGDVPASRGLSQGLIFVVGRDAYGRAFAGHSGSVKGTLSRLTNFHEADVVVALHLNLNDGTVDAAEAAARLAHLVQTSREAAHTP